MSEVIDVRGLGRKAPLRHVGGADSVVDRAAAELRRSILNGNLTPGQSFSIADFSEQLGVSHIPVREAVRHLAAEGLVTLRPGRSAMVNPLSRDELRSIYRLRQLIEPDLAARACTDLDSNDLAQAEELLGVFAEGAGDPDYLWQVHRDFHMVLLRPALSDWDVRILSQLQHASDRYTRLVFDMYEPSDAERAERANSHRALLTVTKSNSPSEVRRAMSEHLSDNEVRCLEAIASLPALGSADRA